MCTDAGTSQSSLVPLVALDRYYHQHHPARGSKSVQLRDLLMVFFKQPLSLLLKLSPLVTELSLYDVVNTPGVAADLSHISTPAVCICIKLKMRYSRLIGVSYRLSRATFLRMMAPSLLSRMLISLSSQLVFPVCIQYPILKGREHINLIANLPKASPE